MLGVEDDGAGVGILCGFCGSATAFVTAELAAKDFRITELEARVTELERMIDTLTAAPAPSTPPARARPGKQAADEGLPTSELTASAKRRRKRRRAQQARRDRSSSAADLDDTADGSRTATAAPEQVEGEAEEDEADEALPTGDFFHQGRVADQVLEESAGKSVQEQLAAMYAAAQGLEGVVGELEVGLEYHLRLAEFAEREREVRPEVDCDSCEYCQACRHQQNLYRRHVVTGLCVQNEVEKAGGDGAFPGVPNDGTLMRERYARLIAKMQEGMEALEGRDRLQVVMDAGWCRARMQVWEELREQLGPHGRETGRAAWVCGLCTESKVGAAMAVPASESVEDRELALAMEISLVQL